MHIVTTALFSSSKVLPNTAAFSICLQSLGCDLFFLLGWFFKGKILLKQDPKLNLTVLLLGEDNID